MWKVLLALPVSTEGPCGPCLALVIMIENGEGVVPPGAGGVIEINILRDKVSHGPGYKRSPRSRYTPDGPPVYWNVYGILSSKKCTLGEACL